ncbi:MAG: hypothetical protein HGB36_10375 [Chlorobiaceae bacterium]|jgi:hypothetical protein|nr:hypothetical protein [Chlorobiaceae bacterium]
MTNRIMKQQYEAAYEASVAVYNGFRSKGAAADKIVAETGINRNSALNNINDYAHMIRGAKYKRAMSVESAEYFLKRIYNDKGSDALKMALKSMRLNIEYRELTSCAS